MPTADEQAYIEYLRTGMYHDLTARVNATFAHMEQENVCTLPAHSGLIVVE